jgi:hypothetical protein
LNITVQR